jgi:hypothetical protein
MLAHEEGDRLIERNKKEEIDTVAHENIISDKLGISDSWGKTYVLVNGKE